MDYGLLSVVAGFVITIIGAVATCAIWISRQFAITNTLVFNKAEQIKEFILDKLDYHERHDDVRFQQMAKDLLLTKDQITKDLWELRVRNAAFDGLHNKRHYFAKEAKETTDISGTS